MWGVDAWARGALVSDKNATDLIIIHDGLLPHAMAGLLSKFTQLGGQLDKLIAIEPPVVVDTARTHAHRA